MKTMHLVITAVTLFSPSLLVGQSLKEDIKKSNTSGTLITPEQFVEIQKKESNTVAKEQDELAADVQDLIQDQTSRKVIKLLDEVELLMGEAAERLENTVTDGNTIAIETEIIEKIIEAVKQKGQ